MNTVLLGKKSTVDGEKAPKGKKPFTCMSIMMTYNMHADYTKLQINVRSLPEWPLRH